MTEERPLHVIFIHLDLGIGGAEQLILQLATASLDLGHTVDIITSRCDQHHCFDLVKKPNGKLSQHVQLYGTWIPHTLFGGYCTALCSTIRILYLTYIVIRTRQFASSSFSSSSSTDSSNPDVVVLDVLPTSIPLLLSWLPSVGILFYCHFPDKLLLRNTTDVTTTTNNNTTTSSGGIKQWMKQQYRTRLDTLEERTMAGTDTLVVNSKFTLSQVIRVFPALRTKESTVLYPALDTSNMVDSIHQSKTKNSPIVSLNRFERKKNISLVIEAYAIVLQKTKQEQQSSNKQHDVPSPSSSPPPLIIAGGYDTKSIENVEYRGELQTLVDTLNITEHVQFLLDISDVQRATLFQTALCVVYTPHQEHFGIVPLEAMYAETPVVAVKSGGPLETVIDGTTGYLCDNSPIAFATAIQQLWENPIKATEMGRTGRIHVEETFGLDRFRNEWKELVELTSGKRWKRLSSSKQQQQQEPKSSWSLWTNTTLYVIEAIVAFLLVLILTWILRGIGILTPTQSLGGAIRQHVFGGGDEL